MPRKPRIEIPGYYHIINRGVEQRVIFKEASDYEYFEELMCFYAKNYSITLHNYCLMSNHYHLLVEIHQENLSKFMRQLNMNYAIYFNKKYKRVGHLWQGRFKSWYVTDEAYLYTLMCYIEQNPLKANMVRDIKKYPYSSYHYFLNYKEIPECLQNAWVVQNYKDDTEAIEAFLTNPVDSVQLQELKSASSLVEAPNVDNKPTEEDLQDMFKNITEIKERNKTIATAYVKGYSQHMIAKVKIGNICHDLHSDFLNWCDGNRPLRVVKHINIHLLQICRGRLLSHHMKHKPIHKLDIFNLCGILYIGVITSG